LTAGELAGLPKIREVYVKDIADAAGCSPSTVRKAMRRWKADPAHPAGLPYLIGLGRPYRTTLEAAVKFLTPEPLEGWQRRNRA